MLENPILVHAFDIDWTVQGLLLASAALSIVFGGGISGTYLLIRSGRRRALTANELETLGRTPELGDLRMHWAGAAGTRVEASASIDTLRRAAKRGDWLLFFAWPCAIVGMGGGCALPFVAAALFMPWAALYTNIDLDVDGPDLYAPAPESSALGPTGEGLQGEPDRRARR